MSKKEELAVSALEGLLGLPRKSFQSATMAKK